MTIKNTCHGCVHLRGGAPSFVSVTYTCARTGNQVTDPSGHPVTPAWCPYLAIPTGYLVRRADVLRSFLSAGPRIGRIQARELQEEAAQMVEDCDPAILDAMLALQREIGEYPVEDHP